MLSPRTSGATALVAIAIGFTSAASQAQQGPPPGASPPAAAALPLVRSLDSFVLVVADLDAAVAFYRDGIGLTLEAPPTRLQLDSSGNAVANTPGARTRYARFVVPNEPYDLKLIEYRDIDRIAVRANHNDPGSSFLNFGSWDGESAFAALRRVKATTVGQGQIPDHAVPGRMAAVWVRDPDGHLLEVMQGGWDPERKSLRGIRNVYRSHFGVTQSDYHQALAFYRDLLGFDITAGFPPMTGAGEYMSAKGLAKMLGVPPEAMMTGVAGHCAGARCEMFEFKDAPRTAFHPRLQDPGAAYLSVWVNDLDAAVAKARAAGLEIVTSDAAGVHVDVKELTLITGQGTGPPERVHSSRQVMIRDPSGFPVLLMQRLD